ncbi:hypothetical protein ACWFR5_37250 [Streptomyces sp. NPDC055092]
MARRRYHQLNAFRARQHVAVRRGDPLTPVLGQCFDLVISNPPYVPTPPSEPRPSLAWNGGRDGRAVVNRLCDGVHRVLRPGGVLLMVQSGLTGIEETLARLSGSGLRARGSDRTYIPFGPVVRARLPWLLACGLVADSEESEELVVIRAEQLW